MKYIVKSEAWGIGGVDLMKRTVFAATALVMLLASSFGVRAASLEARVDISSQTMTVSRHGHVIYTWRVSTARKGYITPRGTYRPQRLHRMWYSRKYEMSPMPWSVFYHGCYAIHGTNAVKHLVRPASQACVRLRTANAAIFYALVQEVGRKNTRIIVTN